MLRTEICVIVILVLLYCMPSILGEPMLSAPDPPLHTIVVGSGPPHVLFISGTHGNEPAGTTALPLIADYMRQNYNQLGLRGTYTFVPAVNAPGLAAGVRNWYGRDLNRAYNGSPLPGPARQLWQLCTRADFVMDFHEGWAWHTTTPESIGSTLTGDPRCCTLAHKLIKILNADLAPNRRFQWVDNMYCDIPSTLACACYKAGIPYMLCETTGQRDVQPLEVRVGQIATICGGLMLRPPGRRCRGHCVPAPRLPGRNAPHTPAAQ